MNRPSRKNPTPLSETGQGLSLLGLRVARDVRSAEHRTLPIGGGGAGVELDGLLALPGLVNAHDHLEFALFPRLGGRRFSNAREWAEAVYRPDSSPVREHLQVPTLDRLVWGGLRNLLGGVTTVCHHNPYEGAVFDGDFPVRLAQKFGWAHSLVFEPGLQARFRRTPPDWPFILHAAEGVDDAAREEIRLLDGIGVLTSRTILAHALGCGADEWALLDERGCGVVWCPSSNRFLFGRTLDADRLASGPPIALGTDSPLTAAGGMFDELACARSCGAPPQALYRMVTATPSQLLHIDEQSRAGDWILLGDRGLPPCEALLDQPALEAVFVGGRPNLVSARLAEAYPPLADGLSPLRHGDSDYYVRADIPGLLERARAVLGPDVRLGGVPVSEVAA